MKQSDIFTQIFSQARKLSAFFCLLYCLPLLFLLAVAIASAQMDVSAGEFTRDFAAVVERHPFIGIASNLGVLLWTATSTICLFTWAVLRHYPSEAKFSNFLLCSGLMTLFLTLDDFFLLHEKIFPDYLGISEKILFIGYGGLVLWGIVTFRKNILKTEYLLLLVSFACFGLSIFVDSFQYQFELITGDWRILVEDGLKMMGIVGWFGYFLRCCLSRLDNKIR